MAFDGLSSGQPFVSGSLVELTWVDTIEHQTTGYHLQFIPGKGLAGIPIASDLPPDQYSFTWEVPAEPCADCALFIIQDNEGSDYTATHPITIVREPADILDGGADAREVMGEHLPPQPSTGGAGGQNNCCSPGSGGARSEPRPSDPAHTQMDTSTATDGDGGCALVAGAAGSTPTPAVGFELLLAAAAAASWSRRRSVALE